MGSICSPFIFPHLTKYVTVPFKIIFVLKQGEPLNTLNVQIKKIGDESTLITGVK